MYVPLAGGHSVRRPAIGVAMLALLRVPFYLILGLANAFASLAAYAHLFV
jgi:hypothetical protein